MNNVLIIEDDKEICVMIKDHLEKYNYQVFFTLTGANAIERIKELSPDLIILDLMLPFISGDELIRNIRKFSDVPVIVVSAKSLTFNKVELLRLGADDYLTKPFEKDELLARIRALVRKNENRTKKIKIGNLELAGTEIRNIFGLKSAKFEILVEGENVKFNVLGYGHGVGMSQTGADSMAKEGKNYEEIIKHYYTGVEIVNL